MMEHDTFGYSFSSLEPQSAEGAWHDDRYPPNPVYSFSYPSSLELGSSNILNSPWIPNTDIPNLYSTYAFDNNDDGSSWAGESLGGSSYWGTWSGSSGTTPGSWYHDSDPYCLMSESVVDISSQDSGVFWEPKNDIEDSITLSFPRYRQYSPTFGNEVITAGAPQNIGQERECPPSNSKRKPAYQPLALGTTGEQDPKKQKSETRYECDQCNAEFSKRGNLERHRRTIHVDDSGSRSICHYESCGRPFSRRDKLTDHLRRYHRENISLNRIPQLSSSLQHDISQPKLFFCDQCAHRTKGFRTNSDLQRHIRSIHKDNETEYVCSSQNCPTPDKTWTRLDNLRSHIARLHSDEDPNPNNLVRISAEHNRPESTRQFVYSSYQIDMNKKGREPGSMPL